MAKRKGSAIERRRKKAKEDQDGLLSSGVFGGANTEETLEDAESLEDWENKEQDYELRPRQATNSETVEGLPIIRAGKVERVVREVVRKEEEVDEAESEEVEEDAETIVPEKPKAPVLTPREKLIKIKEEVADLASKLIEDPEENISCLTKLRKLSESNDLVTSQLAILALIPVFKSLAPAYKIRPLTEAEQREKVGREIARLRNFEQTLVLNYQHYIAHLGKLAKISALNSQNNRNVTEAQIKQGQVAAKAACELCLSSLRHFNFRTELFTIAIRRLNRKPKDPTDLNIFFKCLRALESLLKEDREHGSITFDIVRVMCKVMKDKKYRVDEAVINVFLSLSLLDDYDPNGVKDTVTKKLKKKDRVHFSKKQRKARKETKEIEEEMRKAEQAVTAEERESFQAQTLKMLLALYLEILKAGTESLDEKSGVSLLMAPVLEGLSRFGQMANFDLLGDFLEVLRETMTNIVGEHSLEDDKFGMEGLSPETGGMYDGDEIRKLLLCIAASFALVLNHSEVGRLPISVDLSRFVITLYAILGDICLDSDLEFSHKSLRLADPLTESGVVEKPAVNVSTKAELLLKSLDFIFFRSRNGTLPRAMTITKRLYISLLHTPEKTTIATLKFIAKLVGRFGEGMKGMWTSDDKIAGEGNYILGIEKDGFEVDMERSNIGSAVLWENVLLDKHYCPVIKDGSRSLSKNSKATNSR